VTGDTRWTDFLDARKRVYDRLRRDSEIARLERALTSTDEAPLRVQTAVWSSEPANRLRAGPDRP